MEFNESARVYSADGKEVGKINRFVLDPQSKRVTHLVVEKGVFFPEDKVVPIEWVASATHERVDLSVGEASFHDLPPFEEVHYVSLDEAEQQSIVVPPMGYAPAGYWYPQYGISSYPYSFYPPGLAADVEQNIPDQEVPLKEGAEVIGAGGKHIGDMERLMVDPKSNIATHFLISKGGLVKERKLVPVYWVDTIKEEKIQLLVSERTIERLPDFNPDR
jgi:uncharacterized protein YrrD